MRDNHVELGDARWVKKTGSKPYSRTKNYLMKK
jgi:hypothetical protein